MLAKIAKDLGIAPPNISKQLAHDPEYKQARELGAELRMDRSYSLMAELAERTTDEVLMEGKEAAQALGNLARAREASWKAAAWFAEREFPHRWGQRTQLTIDQKVTVEIAMTDDLVSALQEIRSVSPVIEGCTIPAQSDDKLLISE